MKIEIKFLEMNLITWHWNACDIIINHASFRFFDKTIYSLSHSRLKIEEMNEMCRRMNKEFRW